MLLSLSDCDVYHTVKLDPAVHELRENYADILAYLEAAILQQGHILSSVFFVIYSPDWSFKPVRETLSIAVA